MKRSWHQILPLWANPPFSLLTRIVTKLQMEGGFVVVLCPSYHEALVGLRHLASREVILPPVPLFRVRGSKLLPPPHWRTVALLIPRPPPVGMPTLVALGGSKGTHTPRPYICTGDLEFSSCTRPHRPSSGSPLLIQYASRTFVLTREALWDLRFPVAPPCSLCRNIHWPWLCNANDQALGPLNDYNPPPPTFLLSPPLSVDRWLILQRSFPTAPKPVSPSFPCR